MSEGRLSGCASGAERYKSGNAILLGAADWLSLAAAPAFAFMALLTSVLGRGAPDILCSMALDALPLNGMVLMYALMSAFHLSPWLKLIFSRVQLDVAADDDCGHNRKALAVVKYTSSPRQVLTLPGFSVSCRHNDQRCNLSSVIGRSRTRLPVA